MTHIEMKKRRKRKRMKQSDTGKISLFRKQIPKLEMGAQQKGDAFLLSRRPLGTPKTPSGSTHNRDGIEHFSLASA